VVAPKLAAYTAQSSYENTYYESLIELKELHAKSLTEGFIPFEFQRQLDAIVVAADGMEALNKKGFEAVRSDRLHLAREILESLEYEAASTTLQAEQEKLVATNRVVLSEAGRQIEQKLHFGFIGLAIMLVSASLIAFFWSRGLAKINAKFEQKANESLRDLLEAQSTARIGSWKYNLVTGEQVWSSEHYRIFEIPEPQEPAQLFQSYRARIHPDDHAELDRIIQQALKEGEGFSYRHRVVLDDGKRVKFVLGVGRVALSEEGKPLFLYGTCQDVTDQQAMADSLARERAKSMQSAKLASLGEMSAGIAHEINNPLAIIVGNLRLLRKCAYDETALGVKVATITKAAGRIEKIVNGLKKYSRSSEGSVYKVESLQTIIDEVLILTEAKTKRHSVKVSIRSAGDLKINCDSIEIEQVLVNLVNNGIDAIKDKDEKWLGISAFPDGEQVVVQVIDSGSGISPEIEEKLFQPFFTTKSVGEGTGLGLSISRGILTQHKATLALNRNLRNTCFEIRFPVVSAAEPLEKAAA